MIDDELDPLLRDAAQSYHLPPEPPREAMWEAITRARAASSVTPITGGRQTPRWLVAAAGLAAVLLVGIAIGRASRGSDTPATIANSSPNPGNTEAAAPPIATAAGPSGESVPPKLQVADARLSPNAAERRAARDAANTAIDVASDQSAYRMAVVEHLARTEVLLIGFRAQSHSGGDARVDAQFTALARELLGTTRLLLATRRSDDAALTRLLQDLEFVLMQLSQYASDGRPGDVDAINRSLEKRNVMPKLRSTIPAGVSASAGS